MRACLRWCLFVKVWRWRLLLKIKEQTGGDEGEYLPIHAVVSTLMSLEIPLLWAYTWARSYAVCPESGRILLFRSYSCGVVVITVVKSSLQSIMSSKQRPLTSKSVWGSNLYAGQEMCWVRYRWRFQGSVARVWQRFRSVSTLIGRE